MGKHNSEASILNELCNWVHNIQYNSQTGNWCARFKPGRIVIDPDFKNIVSELEKHVVSEIIELVAEVLELNAADAQKYTREQDVVDLRIVSAIVVENRFVHIRQKAVSSLLGWRNRCSVVTAKREIKVPQIQQKLNRVYKTYPQLQSGSIEILNRN